MNVYRSVHHPGPYGSAGIFARRLVRPLAVCNLPVMIVVLVEVLQGKDILPYLWFGFPAAVFVAFAWTAFRIRSAPAEIVLSDGFADVRTIRDVLREEPPMPARPILDLRKSSGQFQLVVGAAVYEFVDADWPDVERLIADLQSVRAQANEYS